METSAKVYFNGDILTLEEELYAEALFIKDGKINKVGTKEEVFAAAGEDVERIDLQGKTLMPSFIDAHSHFSGYASSFTQVDLKEVVSFEEIKEAIQKFIQKNKIQPGQWIQADGYDQNFLEEKMHPTRELLDDAAPNNPVLAKHKSGHMGVFNTLGLKELGITEETKSPEGGMIEVKNGRLTGYMEEAAYVKNLQEIPMISTEEFIGSLMKAQEAYASYGITTVQEGFVVEQLAPIFQYLMQAKALKIDLIGYLDAFHADELKEKFANCFKQYNNRIKIGGYKMFLDGSPQGRTAWMRTPYQGEEKEYYAYGTQKDEDVEAKLKYALDEDTQMIVHCNGDAACQQYIDQYAKAKANTGSDHEIRPVIIHAQLLDRDQLDQVKELGMIPSFFVAHVYHWGDIHIKNYGIDRAKRISLANSAGQKGILYTFHQDAPVTQPNMLETIWCAVNRWTKQGVLLGEEERVTPYEALKAVTKNAAYQYFEEDNKGTLKEGKLADLVILDKNILKVEPMKIREIQVLETIKEGSTIYKKA